MKHSNEYIALVMGAQHGDPEAFESLVARFQDMAVGYAYSILNDFGLAQDAAQEAFIQAYADLSKLREPAAFPSWFRRIVFKHCDRFVRGKRAETAPWETAALTAADEAGPAEIAERRETATDLYRALHALPGDERAVMVLYYFQDASLKEMAAFLAISAAAVDHRLRSARAHLSERMLTMMQTDLQEKRPSQDAAFVTQVMDSLTGIPGLKGLRSRLAEEIHLSQTSRQGWGLILFDIDNFQAFNQAWGHVAGDCLLAALANQLRLAAGADDFVARQGGEEFAVVVRRATKAEGAALAETLREAVAQRSYRLPELVLPEARYSQQTAPLPPSPANRTFQEGMGYLREGKLAEATASFTQALEQDREHVPSLMELEYLKLRQTLSAGPAEKSVPFTITMSGGVAWYKEGDTPEALLERATGYVALAKQRGRNRIEQEP